MPIINSTIIEITFEIYIILLFKRIYVFTNKKLFNMHICVANTRFMVYIYFMDYKFSIKETVRGVANLESFPNILYAAEYHIINEIVGLHKNRGLTLKYKYRKNN